MPWPRTPRAIGDLSQVNIHPHSASTKKPNQISELVRPDFRYRSNQCEQWWETSFPDLATISCSSNGYASVDVVCSNADVVGVVCSNDEREAVGSTEREVLGILACSKQVLEPVHSKVPEQVQVHSKLVLVHSTVPELELVHNMVLEPVHSMELEQVHSTVQVPELVHNMGLVQEPVHSKVLVLEHSMVLELVHSMVLELVHSMALELGRQACSNEFAEDGSNA